MRCAMRAKFPWMLTIAAMLLTAQAANAGDVFPRVVVTVAPLKPYVDEILGSEGKAANLLRPGQEPHDFALTIPQGEMLAKADVIIVPDLDINPFLKRLLAKNTHAKIIELSALEGADPLPYASENPWLASMKKAAPEKTSSTNQHAAKHDDHHHDDAHEHKSPAPDAAEKSAAKEEKEAKADDKKPVNDPHLWLDPERMAAIALPLAQAIADKAPESRAALTLNARNLTTHLRGEVIPAMRTMLDKHPVPLDTMQRQLIPFITYHAAYQYFLQRFHLTHYGEITTKPEEMMGGKTMATMVSGASSVRLTCLIGEEKTVLMERIATLSGAQIVLLSPEQLPARKDVDAIDWIRNDYDRFLYVTAKMFGRCLG